MQGDPVRAEQLGQASLAQARALGENWSSAVAAYFLGRIALARRDAALARERFSISLATSETLGERANIVRARNGLGMVALQEGDAAGAAGHYREALRLLHELRDPILIVDALEGLACATTLAGQFERTAQLLGAVQAIRRQIGSPRTVHDQARLQEAEGAARAGLDETVFATALAAGQAMSPEQALTYALE